MNFQGNESSEPLNFPTNLGLLILRIATIALLIYYELWLHLGKAWRSVWNEETWGLAQKFENLNLPLHNAVAITIILGSFLVSIGILLGFLVRVNSAILFLIFGFLFLSKIQITPNFTPEAILLYMIFLVTLLIIGPGKFSMDHFFATQRNRRKA